MKTRKKARLTKAEDATYCKCFEWYCNNVRNDSKRADRHAWRCCIQIFPRLASHTGCLP